MNKTIAFHLLVLKKDFTDFCNQKLQDVGVTQGLLYFVIYIGKHQGCSTGELIKELHTDWGHTQRSIEMLVRDGIVDKQRQEHDKRAYSLTLTEKGQKAFSVSHQVFFDWDKTILDKLSVTESEQLIKIFEKLVA